MKLKFSFRFIMVALVTAFSATGCTQNEPAVIPPEVISFQLQVKNIVAGQATLSAIPNDDKATYFYGAMPKADFDAFSTEAAFLDAEILRIKALAEAQQMTPVAYLQANVKQGAKEIKISTMVPLTEYYAYIYTIDATGKATSKLFKVGFTSGEAPATAPQLELTMTPGDMQGLEKDVKMTLGTKSSGVTSGKLIFVLKSNLDEAIAKGETLETITNNDKNGFPLEPAELDALNSEEGWKYEFTGLSAASAYTAIVKVTNAIGSTIKEISESTLADAGSNAPELTLSLVKGDKDGNNKNTCLTGVVKSTGALAGNFALFAKSAVDGALDQGLTLADIMTFNGVQFNPDQLMEVNSADGLTLNYVKLKPNVAYSLIIKVASPGGTTIEAISATTTTGIGPELTVSVIPGDKNGGNKDINLLLSLKSIGVLSGRHALMTKADFDAEIANGTTPAQILTASSITLTATDIAAINSTAGMTHVFDTLAPSTAYKHIVEADSENGRSYQYTDALTEKSNTSTSDMTFTFEIEDLAPTSGTLTVIPSNNLETYYFDFLEVEQYDKLTDAEWIAKLSGSAGISSSMLTSGTDGYTPPSFDYLPMTPNTSYYLYAFGYDAATKSATTKVMKHEFKTPDKNEPATAAYAAWLGTWSVTSSSSEKNATPFSMEIEITPKANNSSYYINNWGITTYRTRNITAALKSDGSFRIKNRQDIASAVAGRLTFVGRYLNPSTVKYAMAVTPVDALIGTLDASGQTATINGNTFTTTDTSGVTHTHTVTGMDFYNNKDNGTWVGYTALAAFASYGNGVGPFTMTKISAAPTKSLTGTPNINAQQSEEYKLHLAKRALINKPATAKSTTNAPKAQQSTTAIGTHLNSVMNLSISNDLAPRFNVEKLDLTK